MPVSPAPSRPPRSPRRRAAVALAAGLLASAAVPAGAADHDDILSRITLPPGFQISVFAEVPGARSLDVTDGIVHVGSRQGHVYALADRDGDGVAEEVVRRADGLKAPNGVAVHDGRLYVGLQDRILRSAPGAGADPSAPLEPWETLYTDVTDNRHHGWRYIGFSPEGRLHVALGAPCNICALTPTTGKIISMTPEGTDPVLVADGVRNSVGFAWHPETGEMFFTDNGADGLGDDIPPDELNRVTAPGGHYGFPWRGGEVALGPDMADAPAGMIAPEVAFAAHTASLGMAFATHADWPGEMRGDAIVAQHGSWNRSVPIGYRLVRVAFDAGGNPGGHEVFAEGWLTDDGAVGRPADVAEMPDGALLVSDDYAGLVYRIIHAR